MDAPAESAAEPRDHRERVRADAVESIPRWYSPTAHLLATSGVGLGVVAWAIGRLTHVRPVELGTVAVSFLLSNAVEWRAHKDLLHHRRWPMHTLYDRHTPLHHVVYGYDDMALRSWREARLVLLPAVGIVGIVALAAPFAYGAGLALGPNVGWLALASTAAYVLLYEWSHLAYHLPLEHPIAKLRVVAALREQHRRHHHPRLMKRWNFNVTVPLFDWIHRTLVPDDLVAEVTRAAPRED